MADIHSMLSKYPKNRPPLTEAHQQVYEKEYKLNRDGSRAVEGIAQKLEKWMHRQVASNYGGPVLELGAGTLNHVPFEASDIDYDIVEPFAALYEGSPSKGRCRNVYASQNEIQLQPTYKRIISVAVLEHMTDLPREIAQAGLLLQDEGLFQAGIPSEGGFLWWLAWRCTTGFSYYLRNGLDYGVLMKHEHVNTAPEILAILRYFFTDVKVRRFPLPFHHLSFYTYSEASGPRRDRCQEFLKAHGPVI